jgi:hypothetical protein
VSLLRSVLQKINNFDQRRIPKYCFFVPGVRLHFLVFCQQSTIPHYNFVYHQKSGSLENQYESILNKSPKLFNLKDFKDDSHLFDPDNFNILHAGSLMKQRPPFIVIKVFQDFLKNQPEAKIKARLIFIGNVFDGHKEELNSYASSNVIVYNQYMGFNVVFELQQQASMNVVIEANTPYSPFLPGKMPHLVIAYKPILHVGSAYSETMRLLGEEYPLHVSNHESHVTKLSEKLVLAYKEWSTKKSFSLQRTDLREYLSKINLE